MSATLEMPQWVTTTRESWLAERKSYLGATDLSAILGQNPYSSRLEVYCDKLSLVPPVEQTHAMTRGLRLEPYVAQLAADELGLPVAKWPEPVRHVGKPYLGVNPDYWVPPPGSEFQDRAQLVECKTHLPYIAHHYGEPGTDHVPTWEIIQAQWQMHLTSIRICHVAVLFGMAEEDFRLFTVHRDAELGSMLEEAADKFWHDHILARIAPPVGHTDADADLLKRLYPLSRETAVIATPEVNGACGVLQQARKDRKAAEAAELMAENVIKAFMADASELESAHGCFTWRTSKGSPKWKAIAEELGPSPHLIAKHTASVGPRKFLTPFKGE